LNISKGGEGREEHERERERRWRDGRRKGQEGRGKTTAHNPLPRYKVPGPPLLITVKVCYARERVTEHILHIRIYKTRLFTKKIKKKNYGGPP